MICNKCSLDKENDCFYKRNKSKTGYSDWCKECTSLYQKEYFINNKSVIKKYQSQNKNKIKEYQDNYNKLYYQENKIIKPPKQYKQKGNPNYYKEYFQKRYKEDVNYRLSYILRSRLKFALKTNSKTSSAITLLGCSIFRIKTTP